MDLEIILIGWCVATALLVVGALTPVFARTNRGWPRWLHLAAFVISVVAWAAVAVEWAQNFRGAQPITWTVDWLTFPGVDGALVMGLRWDGISLLFGGGFTLLATLGWIQLMLSGESVATTKAGAAQSVGILGVVVAATSTSPWGALVGFAFCALGAAWGLSQRPRSEGEARWVSRHLREHAFGVVACLAGLLMLGTRGQGLVWAPIAGGDAPPRVLTWGAALVFAGAVSLLRGFPFVGWHKQKVESSMPVRAFLVQMPISVAAFAFLARLQVIVLPLGLNTEFGWVASGLGLATVACVLLHAESGVVMAGILASINLFATAALFSSSVQAGFGIALGAQLGVAAYALFDHALRSDAIAGDKDVAALRRATVAKVGVVFALGAVFFLPGWVGMSGWGRYLGSAIETAPRLAVIAICYACGLALALRLIWSGISASGVSPKSGATLVLPFLLVLASLSVLWLGGWAAELLPNRLDAFWSGVVPLLSGAGPSDSLSEEAVMRIWLAALGAWALGGSIAFGLCRKDSAVIRAIAESGNPALRFVDRSFGLESLGALVLRALWVAGRALERWLGDGLWKRGIPRVADWGVVVFKRLGALLSVRFGGGFEKWVGAVVEVPGLALQVLHAGDVQKYLVFAIVGAAALLLHFMGHWG